MNTMHLVFQLPFRDPNTVLSSFIETYNHNQLLGVDNHDQVDSMGDLPRGFTFLVWVFLSNNYN